MGFYFDSWSEFLVMDGHGAFVWAAFVLTWLVLGYLLLSPWLAHRRWLRQQRQRLRRQMHQNPAGSP